MGCRHYFVADRLEDLVDEGVSRSSSRVHEHGSFRLVGTLWERNSDFVRTATRVEFFFFFQIELVDCIAIGADDPAGWMPSMQ